MSACMHHFVIILKAYDTTRSFILQLSFQAPLHTVYFPSTETFRTIFPS
jgi:hypothetical protein